MSVTKFSITNIILFLCVFLISASSCAEATEFRASEYSYALTLPPEWVQIPDNVIARFKANHLPKQAQHLIFDTAFQRQDSKIWFDWPYIVVQVIPDRRDEFDGLPTEAEFQRLVSALSGRQMQAKFESAISELPDPDTKKLAESFADSLSTASVQVNFAQRKYWYVVESGSPERGSLKTLIAGFFLTDGSIIQIACYSLEAKFNENLDDFVAVIDSFHRLAVPSTGRSR